MLHRIALLAIAAPRRVLAVAALLMVAAAVFGVPVAKSLSAGGFQDPSAESSRATQLLTDKFGQRRVQLTIMVTAPDGVRGAAARAAGADIVNQLKNAPYVMGVVSPWTAPPQAAAELVSKDGRSGLVVVGISGGEKEAPARAQVLADAVSQSVLLDHRGVTVLAGGSAMVYSQINSQTERDLLVMESIALPVSFAVLVWVFGGPAGGGAAGGGGWAGDCRIDVGSATDRDEQPMCRFSPSTWPPLWVWRWPSTTHC